MPENTRLSPMWRKPEFTAGSRLTQTLERGVSGSVASCPTIWFRADDVAVASGSFAAMADCFRRHRIPLAPAVVPSWLSLSRWREIEAVMGKNGRWSFHQHGRRHLNHEPVGRKSEFGPARSAEAKRRDILLGRQRLERIMGDDFLPVFTAPWNRFDAITGQCLRELGFLAASRNDKAFNSEPIDLPEIPVNCDLHTRRGTPSQTWNDFFAEVESGLQRGLLGVMLHHQRMNSRALEFLDIFLSAVAASPRLRVASLEEMVIEAKFLKITSTHVRSTPNGFPIVAR
ncbi:polysaccharide deacetylase family protein [Desulfonatronum thiosulfatophilum]|nr:polysaccharide deacetylase family protein [Desulfonatronum thiosulfatophilum]